MRRTTWGVIAALGAAAAIGVAQAAPKDKPKAAAAAEAPAVQASAPAQEQRVVHAFQDDQQLQQFTQLWQQRQGLLIRLSVLQAYASEEQVALQELDNQFASTYHLDMRQLDRYTLDAEKKVLIERAAAEAAAPSPPPATPAQP